MAERGEFVLWVGRHILPYEAGVRAWLKRAAVPPADIDDIIQESYCKIAELDDIRHITNPRAYFYQVARNLVFQQARRARIVRIDTVAEIEDLRILDERPNPEEAVTAFREVERLRAVIEKLPEKCREVFVLRKIEGLSQKAIAARLGISESTVEAHVTRGLKLILLAWSEEVPAVKKVETSNRDRNGRSRKRD